MFAFLLPQTNANMAQMQSRMHLAVSDAPDIERVIEETRRTPFTDRIACFRIRDVGRLRFPEYDGTSYPKAHLRSFRFAITRAYLTDEENVAGHCRFFVENLVGYALEWFSSLEGNSIDTFNQLAAAFLKHYSVLIEHRTCEADLWSLTQLQKESLRSYVKKFKVIKSKIANLNEEGAIAALRNGLWFSSRFREELTVRQPVSLDDALHKALHFAKAEQELAVLALRFKKSKTQNAPVATKKPFKKENQTQGQHTLFTIEEAAEDESPELDLRKYCKYHKKEDIPPRNVAPLKN